MKICPQCRTTYTDDSLQYCLQDGTPLDIQNNSQNFGAPETLVSPQFTTNKVNPEWQNPPAPNWADSEQTRIAVKPQKSRTGLIIALTALVTLIVIGGGIAGFLVYERNHRVEIAQNTNVNSKPVNAANSSGNQQKNTNSNSNSNAAPSPSQTPSAKPSLDPKQIETIKSDISDVIENWKDATENHDLEAHLKNYADTVDYYKAGKVSSARVRADRQRAFAMYNDMQINIDNVKITPDESGEKAVATLDKEWSFENEEKSNSGKVQQQLTFEKINGAWRITGEKDLKVYYLNK